MWVILLHRNKDLWGPGADQLPKSFPNGLQGLGLASESFTCFSVLWLWACAHSHVDLDGCAGSREHPRCSMTLGGHVPTGFPTLRSSHGFSACIPWGTQRGLGCWHPAGGIEASEHVCKLAETENLSSSLDQQYNKDKPCITGMLLLWKLEASQK